MAVYTKDSKLNEPIFEDPSVVAVINRFGFFLGVGDETIEESCRHKNIDVDFFLAIINTYLNPDYLPEKIIGKKYLPMVMEYLEKTDRYYREIQLPNIDRHFSLLIRNELNNSSNGEKTSNLQLLNRFYEEVKEELESMQPEYPYDRSGLEDKIRDLISFFVIHLRGVENHNLCIAVVSAIFVLEKDIRQNNRIRNRILRPLCEE